MSASILAHALVVLALSSNAAHIVFGLAMAGAILSVALALLLIDGDKRSRLERRLSGYDLDAREQEVPASRAELVETQIVQSAVGLTGRLADRIGLLTRVDVKLEQADLPLRPPEALFFYFSGVFFVAVISFVLLKPLSALIATALVIGGPVIFLSFKSRRRLRKFEVQLPDVLALLAGSMRAGFSFAQGLEAVADESSEPSRRELQRAFAESRLGRPVEDALEDSADRMESVDLAWAVMAIRIQREVGGNLAELLDTVASTMTQRERLRHEIGALTAEGRMSAWILGIFPPLFGVLLWVIQPNYMNVMLQSKIGVMALGASAVMAVIGFIWLRKMMKIEV